MTLGNKIAQFRKTMNMTQDALAQQLGVTNQAVSKWESDQCCPDVMLLPKIADIFGITIDELFGREAPPKKAEKEESGFKRIFNISLGKSNSTNWSAPEPVWPDDKTLRVAAYIGHRLVKSIKDLEKLTFQYDGPALNIDSQISVTCGDVDGDVDAGRDVTCGNVCGDVDAGRDVNCGNADGDVEAGRNVKCGDVCGDVDAGGNVECTKVEGDIDAGGSVTVRK